MSDDLSELAIWKRNNSGRRTVTAMIELANKVLSARLEIVECSGCGTERFRIDAVTERLAKEYLAAQQRVDNLTADNARLREAIQSVLGYVALPHRYREELEAAIEQS